MRPAPLAAHDMQATAERAGTLPSSELVRNCQGLVRSLAWKIQRKLPPHIEIDDLIAFGEVGLLEAVRAFNPDFGGKFITYAYYRIRGAIFDGLSKMSWFSFHDYHSSRYERMANEVLRIEHDDARDAAPATLEDDVTALKRVIPPLAVVYLATGGGRDDNEGRAALADEDAPSPPEQAMVNEIGDVLRRMIDALPADAGSLMRGVYYEGLTLQEAGERLGISKAWASRLHAKTLRRLAHALRLVGYEG